ncbi:hypothetical protein A9Q87_03385 [Flavobacteriales bacterium 34_180_T64]|nr:hypothetical protein A9Q87_03385 [Flavobacteriales bacterium 34_180_T64]
MDAKFFTLKEVNLNNNCPECYSREGLQLTFFQKFIENQFFKAITTQTIEKLYCYTCKTEIFSIRWTNDIDQVVAYQKRAATPKTNSIKLKKLSWILITSIAVVLAGIILYTAGLFDT